MGHPQAPSLLFCIVTQAVGQMMTDDWSNSISYGWDNIEADFDWRFSGFQAEDHKRMKAVSDEEPIDIEGEFTITPLYALPSTIT